jgi:hypothetical protein
VKLPNLAPFPKRSKNPTLHFSTSAIRDGKRKTFRVDTGTPDLKAARAFQKEYFKKHPRKVAGRKALMSPKNTIPATENKEGPQELLEQLDAVAAAGEIKTSPKNGTAEKSDPDLSQAAAEFAAADNEDEDGPTIVPDNVTADGSGDDDNSFPDEPLVTEQTEEEKQQADIVAEAEQKAFITVAELFDSKTAGESAAKMQVFGQGIATKGAGYGITWLSKKPKTKLVGEILKKTPTKLPEGTESQAMLARSWDKEIERGTSAEAFQIPTWAAIVACGLACTYGQIVLAFAIAEKEQAEKAVEPEQEEKPVETTAPADVPQTDGDPVDPEKPWQPNANA